MTPLAWASFPLARLFLLAWAGLPLRSWRILRQLRCCPWRAGQLAKAIHVLQAREIQG